MYTGPGREWRDATAEHVQQYTQLLRVPGGSEVARPLQAAAVHEGRQLGGAFIFGRAGIGKTWVAGVLPVLLAQQGYRRPLILTAGKMCKRTREHPHGETGKEFARMRQHWRIVEFFELKSYTFLTRAENATWLEQWRPDVIICDEAHALRRLADASVPKRIKRYLDANPAVRVFAMSGTFHKSKLLDYAHILNWCLRDQSPLPDDPAELEAWSKAIDEGDAIGIRHIAKYGCPTESWDAAKAWYANRLRRTPGVIISDDAFTGSRLRIDVVNVNPQCEPEFEALRDRLERPDGYALTPDRKHDDGESGSALAVAGTVWQVARQLALGFYYTFDPQPPAEWLRARKAWARFVRAMIEQQLADTELQVWQACEQGSRRVPEFETWRAIRDTFRPTTVARWVNDRALRFAQWWGSQAPGLIWCEHEAVRLRLSELTGWRHYGPGGLDPAGRHVSDAKSAHGSIILSRQANFEGRNLQYEWHRNCALGIPNANLIFEQEVARSHRDGQRSPEVTFTVYAGCIETQGSLMNILREAKHSYETTTLAQRVLDARIEVYGDVPADCWAWRTNAKRESSDGATVARGAFACST